MPGTLHTPAGVTIITVLAGTSPVEVLRVKMREQKTVTGAADRKVEAEAESPGG